MKLFHFTLISIACILSYAPTIHALDIRSTVNAPQVTFAIEKIEASVPDNIDSKVDTIAFTLNPTLPEQSFQFSQNENLLTVTGADKRGLMYGGLELAEHLALYGNFERVDGKLNTPKLLRRGIKINIPLDARTPSYDDTGDAAQTNILHMWDFEFWKKHLDELATHRFNVITFWNPHPFPSMIKMEDYPEIALDDVYQTTLTPTGYENEWGEPGLVSTNVTENLKKVKSITIDEKIDHWTKVFNYANNRGIDLYFINWNICPNSIATPVEPMYKTYRINMHEEVPGKYGITHQLDNQKTIRYYRETIAQFLRTYPQIKGIGITAGEHMPLSWNGYNREKWLWETYGLGIIDLKEEQPERHVELIHRVWHSDMEQIMDYWGNYPDLFTLSFKYAKARLYSHPDLPFVDSHIEETSPYHLKSWWNLRNDDNFVYRWGDSDYVRSFINHIPHDHTRGIHMGSDGYVWGKTFNSKHPELMNQLEVEKHWFRYYLWGRLAFDPELSEETIHNAFNAHFKIHPDWKVYDSLKYASKGIPLINTFHWRDWDHHWSVESCQARPALGGFHSLTDFVNTPTMETSNFLSPIDFAENGLTEGKQTPFEVAYQLRKIVSESNAKAITAQPHHPPELATLIEDIEALNALSLYYAYKIEAATHLALYETKAHKESLNHAITSLETAIEHWKTYTEISEKNYLPQHLARVQYFDWSQLLKENQTDLENLKKLAASVF